MMEFVWIEPGRFVMGAPLGDLARSADETPTRQVMISKGLYLGKYEITQSQWMAIMGTAPWTGKQFVETGATHPAVYISWTSLQEFLRRLNESVGETLYRLPTGGEWEYACRAGTSTPWSFGGDETQLHRYAWFADNAPGAGMPYAQPVGSKLPNPWGLYDMHGNVWEWVMDWYGASYDLLAAVDPAGPASGTSRVMRGGGFVNPSRHLRSAKRFSYDPSLRYGALGGRLVRTRE